MTVVRLATFESDGEMIDALESDDAEGCGSVMKKTSC